MYRNIDYLTQTEYLVLANLLTQGEFVNILNPEILFVLQGMFFLMISSSKYFILQKSLQWHLLHSSVINFILPHHMFRISVFLFKRADGRYASPLPNIIVALTKLNPPLFTLPNRSKIFICI
jgi:hypothetical protein